MPTCANDQMPLVDVGVVLTFGWEPRNEVFCNLRCVGEWCASQSKRAKPEPEHTHALGIDLNALDEDALAELMCDKLDMVTKEQYQHDMDVGGYCDIDHPMCSLAKRGIS